MEIIHLKATADVSEADGELERFANRLQELERFGEGSGGFTGVGSGLAELEDVFERASSITRSLVGDLESLQSSGLRPISGVGIGAARSIKELSAHLAEVERGTIGGAKSIGGLKGVVVELAKADREAAKAAKGHAQGLKEQREEASRTHKEVAALASAALKSIPVKPPPPAPPPQILLPGQSDGQGLATDDLARVAAEVAKFEAEVAKFKATAGAATPELDKLRDSLDDFDSVVASGAAGIEGQEETLRGLVGTLQTVGGAYDEVGDLLRDVRKRADEYGFSSEEQAAALNSVLGAAKSSNLPLAKQARIMEELIIETQDAARAQELYADALDLVARRGGRVEDQISKLTDASKGHTSSLSELGPRARALASGYENIRDRQLKGRLVLEAYNTEARRTPDALDKINDSLTIGQAKIGAFMARLGPAGLLLGAFAAGVAASVGAAWNAAIAVTERGIDTIRERSEAAAAAASRFEASKGEASAGIVGSLLGREGTAGIERALAARLEGLAETYERAQSGVDGFTFAVVRNLSAISAFLLTTLPFVGSMVAVAQAENAAAEEAKLIKPALLAQSEAYSQAARAAATMTTRDRERIIATGEVIVREDGRVVAVRAATAAEREAAQAEAEHIQQLENLARASAAGVGGVGRLGSAFGGLSSSISGATGKLQGFTSSVQTAVNAWSNSVLNGGLGSGPLANTVRNATTAGVHTGFGLLGVNLDAEFRQQVKSAEDAGRRARRIAEGVNGGGGGGGGGGKDPIADIRREIDEVIAAASKARELQELLRSTSLDTVGGGLESLREEYTGLTEAIDAYQIALGGVEDEKVIEAVLSEIDGLLDRRLELEDFIEQLEESAERLGLFDELNKASEATAELRRALEGDSDAIKGKLQELGQEAELLEGRWNNAMVLGLEGTAVGLDAELQQVLGTIEQLNKGLEARQRFEKANADFGRSLDQALIIDRGPDAIVQRLQAIGAESLRLRLQITTALAGGFDDVADAAREKLGQVQDEMKGLQQALPEARMKQFTERAGADFEKFGLSVADSFGQAAVAGGESAAAMHESLQGAVADMVPMLAGLASAYLAAQSLNPFALFAATLALRLLSSAASSAFSGNGRRSGGSARSTPTTRRDLQGDGRGDLILNVHASFATKREFSSEVEAVVNDGRQRMRINNRRRRVG